jgi:RNA polymerase sigma-70 factor (ECF subfamily)
VEHDDRALVQRCLAGDQAACAELVDGCARMVGTVIWRATRDGDSVEDLTQETVLRAFRALRDFAGRAKLSTWICTIAHRVAIDHLRKTGAWREEPPGTGDEPDELHAASVDKLAATTVDPETAAARTELDRLVNDGLAQLPDKYRLPLVYAAIDGLDYSTIATMLGVPVGTVKTLVFRAKLRLKQHVGESLDARTARRQGFP